MINTQQAGKAMENTVLITAIGSFSSDAAIRSCRALGMRVIGTDIYPMEWVAQSLDVDAFYQVDKAVNAGAYIEELTEIIKEEGVTLLMPSTDAEVDVLDRYRQELKEAGCTLCLSGQKTIEICRDKMKFARLIGEFDRRLLIPTGYVGDTPEPEFPVICKPADGRSSIGLERIYDQAHYELVSRDHLVQPLIEGSVITVDAVRHPRSHYTEVMARQELLRTPSGAGTSVRIFSDWELEAVCRELAEKLQVIGCVCFEFIRDEDGHYHILECNPRLSGGVAFSCMAGYDFIKAHIACFTEDDIEVKGEIQEMYIARKYKEYIM